MFEKTVRPSIFAFFAILASAGLLSLIGYGQSTDPDAYKEKTPPIDIANSEKQLADSYEPDNAPEQATPIAIGSSSDGHTITQDGDEDWFRFEVTEGEYFIVETTGPDGGDTILELFDESSNSIASDDDGGTDYYSRIIIELEPDTYYVRVTAYERSTGDAAYALAVTAAGLLVDGFEPDDTSDSATTVELGVPSEGHSYFPEEDEDWYRFTLNETSQVAIEATEGSVQVFDSDLAPVTYYGPSQVTLDLDAGTYFVIASGGEIVPDYGLSVNRIPITEDLFEVDNSPDLATLLGPNMASDRHSIFPVDDEDWYRFELIEASHVVLEGSGGYAATTIEVFDENGTSLAFADFINQSGARVSTILNTGSYFVSVEGGMRRRLVQDYSLTLSVAVPPAATGGLDRDVPVTVSFDEEGERTLFRLSVDSAGLLRIPFVSSEEDGGVYMSLMHENRFIVGSFYDLRAMVQPGEYTLLLEAEGGPISGDIFYEILDVDEFELDDSPYLATPIELGTTSEAHTLYPARDQDWFSFELAAPSTVSVETTARQCDHFLMILTNSLDPISFGTVSEWAPGIVVQAELPAGTYFIKVVPSLPSSTCDIGPYSLSVHERVSDAYEPDDAASEATFLQSGESQEHSIHIDTDEDWFSVELESLSFVRFELNADYSVFGMELYDSEFTLTAWSALGSYEGYSQVFTLLPAGTYFVRTFAPESTSIWRYSLAYSSAPVATSAEPLPLNGAHGIEVPAGTRILTYSLDLDDERTIFLGATPGMGAGNFTLYDENGLLISSGRTIYLTLGPGAYHLAVGFEDPSGTNEFVVATVEGDQFEPDNSSDGASQLQTGLPHGPHTLAPESDEDWLKFTVDNASHVTLSASGAGNGLNVTLFDGAHEPVASGVQIQRDLVRGIYYAKVSMADVPLSLPEYHLLLEFQSIPEPPTYRFHRMTPTLQQPWYFGLPADVAISPTGEVYVLDRFGHRVVKLTSSGQVLLTWGRQAPNFSGGPGEFSFPSGIAVSPEGDVYVVDDYNSRIQRFSGNGVYLSEWGGSGSAPGQFHFYHFEGESDLELRYGKVGIVASKTGEIYVCDYGNSRIQVFDADGNYLRSWAVQHPPTAITRSQTDEMYVGYANSTSVTLHDSDGNQLGEFDTSGKGTSEPNGPYGLSVRSDGAVAVSHSGPSAHEVLIFDRSGTVLERIAVEFRGLSVVGTVLTPQPSGIVFDALDNLYVASSGVEKFSGGGIRLSDWRADGEEAGSYRNPCDVAVDDAGRVYIADCGMGRVQRISSSGSPQILLSRETLESIAPGEVVGVDIHEGMLYVVTQYGIVVSDLDGTVIRVEHLPDASAMTVGPSGSLLVAFSTSGQIVRFDRDFAMLGSWDFASEYEVPLELFEDPLRFDLALNIAGNILIPFVNAFPFSQEVREFTETGQFVRSWGTGGLYPRGVAVDPSGYVYVSDALTNRVERFTPDGEYLDTVVPPGDAPGFCRAPGGIDFGPDGMMYFTELGNNRVQSLKPVQVASNSRAIVVAAGGPFPGNQLWDTTQFCANFAMRALAHQGFRNEDIYYLSSDSDLDLDNNGQPDDVDGDVTGANLAEALTEWAVGADSLVVYLVDHGGSDTFRMSQNEVLSATELGAWLDTADAGITGRITVIYDACQSGSFLEELEGTNRIVITSSDAEESAYFLSTGTISFSNFFWTHVFNGFSVADAFAVATDAIGQSIGFQTPQLSDQDRLAGSTYIGNGTEIIGEVPVIIAATEDQPMTGSAGMDLFAEIDDPDGISRAWAVVRPPNFAAPSPDNPVQNLPVVELQPIAQDAARWEGRFDGFTHEGVYRLSFYARDAIGNTSLPVQRTITVGDPLFRRAILLGGGAGRDITTEAVEESLRIAYNALVSQGYGDDDIRIYAPTTFGTGGDDPHPVELNVLENLDFALGEWLGDNTQDLLVYAAGDGDTGALVLNEGQVLTADDLATRLQGAQERLSGVLTVVLDSPRSGSFLPALAAPSAQRIVIASAAAEQDVCLAPQRSISFSNYFWRRVLNGANVSEAFTHAALAMSFAAMGQSAELDDDGDGIYDTATDGLLAGRYSIGSGILLAGDDPIIGQVSDPLLLDGETAATIWADQVTTTSAITSVYAVIQLPPASVGSKAVSCGERPVEVVELHALNGRYEGEYNGIYYEGAYDINIVAIDDDGAVSLPEQTQIVQMQSTEGPIDPDSFEDDDTPDSASNSIVDGPAQSHNFHDSGDEDWAIFVVAADQILTLRTEGLGSAGDTLLELYAADGTTLLASNNDRGPQDPASEIRHSVTTDALLYARIRHAGGVFGAGTEYDFRVLREAGPSSGGGIAGVVIDKNTREPVTGATVQVKNRSNAGRAATEDRTGDNGEFLFLQLESGDYDLEVLGGETYENATRNSLDLSSGALLKIIVEMVEKGTGEGKNPAGCGPSDASSAPGTTYLSGDLLLIAVLLLLMLGCGPARAIGRSR